MRTVFIADVLVVARSGWARSRAASAAVGGPGRWRRRGQRLSLLPLVSLLAALAAACAPAPPAARPAGGERLRVVTTVLPITLFTRAVAGHCAEVQALIPAGAGAHDLQARPADGAALQRARVLVKNGLGLDDGLDRLQASAGRADLVVIDASRGITPLTSEPEPHPADHGHQHGPVNPHVWLDPLRAVQQVEAVRDGLVAADPPCAQTYRRNAAAFIGRLRQLDRQLAAQLAAYRGRTLVAFHDVAPYFAQRYGLRAEFLVAGPSMAPAPADLRRVAQLVQRHRLRALLGEPQQRSGPYQALARDLGVELRIFDPLESATAAQALQPGTYLEVMARNGEQVRGVFAAP